LSPETNSRSNDMSKWTYAYDDSIPPEDRLVLEEKKEPILGALMYKSVYRRGTRVTS